MNSPVEDDIANEFDKQFRGHEDLVSLGVCLCFGLSMYLFFIFLYLIFYCLL